MKPTRVATRCILGLYVAFGYVSGPCAGTAVTFDIRNMELRQALRYIEEEHGIPVSLIDKCAQGRVSAQVRNVQPVKALHKVLECVGGGSIEPGKNGRYLLRTCQRYCDSVRTRNDLLLHQGRWSLTDAFLQDHNPRGPTHYACSTNVPECIICFAPWGDECGRFVGGVLRGLDFAHRPTFCGRYPRGRLVGRHWVDGDTVKIIAGRSQTPLPGKTYEVHDEGISIYARSRPPPPGEGDRASEVILKKFFGVPRPSSRDTARCAFAIDGNRLTLVAPDGSRCVFIALRPETLFLPSSRKRGR